jgi:N-carbamoylputrescine amidase
MVCKGRSRVPKVYGRQPVVRAEHLHGAVGAGNLQRVCIADVNAILSPRATAATTTNKWLAVGTVAAVRSGAYSLSSNRVQADGAYGGAGWIISPDGELLAKTSSLAPFSTLEIDLDATAAAQRTYPRYAFAAGA